MPDIFEKFNRPEEVPFLGPERMEPVIGAILKLFEAQYPAVFRDMVLVHLALEPGYLDARGIPHGDEELETIADTQALYWMVNGLLAALMMERKNSANVVGESFGEGPLAVGKLN